MNHETAILNDFHKNRQPTDVMDWNVGFWDGMNEKQNESDGK